VGAQGRRIRRDLRKIPLVGLVAGARRIRSVVQGAEIRRFRVARCAVGGSGVGGRRFIAACFGGPRVGRGNRQFPRFVVALQQGVFLQETLEFLVEFQRRQLQEPYLLLQLRGKR
jgi:hypothetical protein